MRGRVCVFVVHGRRSKGVQSMLIETSVVRTLTFNHSPTPCLFNREHTLAVNILRICLVVVYRTCSTLIEQLICDISECSLCLS